jgi:hypothetical protein
MCSSLLVYTSLIGARGSISEYCDMWLGFSEKFLMRSMYFDQKSIFRPAQIAGCTVLPASQYLLGSIAICKHKKKQNKSFQSAYALGTVWFTY